MGRYARIGDIIEVRTQRGLAYLHYCRNNPQWGQFVWAYSGFYETRPTSFDGVLASESPFQIYLPLNAAVNRKILFVAGHAPLTAAEQRATLFRGSNDGVHWWLSDGSKEWYVGSLTPEQWRYPIESVWNDTMLIERLEEGYRQEGALS